MRFIFVLILWAIILGGMLTYQNRSLSLAGTSDKIAIEELVIHEAEYELVFITSFDFEEDPFTLKKRKKSTIGEFVIGLNGESLKHDFDKFSRGKEMRITLPHRIRQGMNELYVQISPPVSENTLQHALRIMLLEGEKIIFEKTVWNTKGEMISDLIFFVVEEKG